MTFNSKLYTWLLLVFVLCFGLKMSGTANEVAAFPILFFVLVVLANRIGEFISGKSNQDLDVT